MGTVNGATIQLLCGVEGERRWGAGAQGSPVVRQFLSGADGRCSHLVACPALRVAALIDPEPGRDADYDRALAQLGCELAFVLETTSEELEPDGDVDRFRGLLGELGLEVPAPPAPTPSADERPVPHVRPVQAWLDADPDACVLQVGAALAEVSVAREDLPVLRVGGPVASTLGLAFRGVEIVLGALLVSARPLGGGAVAYLVADRLFVGGPLADLGADALRSLRDLPDEVVVCSSEVVGGAGLSTLGLLRACADRSVRAAPRGAPPAERAGARRSVTVDIEALRSRRGRRPAELG